jgi:hypothetical protein
VPYQQTALPGDLDACQRYFEQKQGQCSRHDRLILFGVVGVVESTFPTFDAVTLRPAGSSSPTRREGSLAQPPTIAACAANGTDRYKDESPLTQRGRLFHSRNFLPVEKS